MQLYIHAPSNTYPLTANDIKAREPNTSFPQYLQPEDISHFGYFPVQATDPTNTDTQHSVEAAPVLTNGVWMQTWTVIDYTPTELAQRAADKAAADAAAAAEQKAAIEKEFSTAIQSRLDAFAQTRNYDGILSACTYASSTVTKFKAEGQYCVDARDNTWATCYTILAQVEAGTIPMPTLDEVLAQLPVLTWPI